MAGITGKPRLQVLEERKEILSNAIDSYKQKAAPFRALGIKIPERFAEEYFTGLIDSQEEIPTLEQIQGEIIKIDSEVKTLKLGSDLPTIGAFEQVRAARRVALEVITNREQPDLVQPPRA